MIFSLPTGYHLRFFFPAGPAMVIHPPPLQLPQANIQAAPPNVHLQLDIPPQPAALQPKLDPPHHASRENLCNFSTCLQAFLTLLTIPSTDWRSVACLTTTTRPKVSCFIAQQVVAGKLNYDTLLEAALLKFWSSGVT